MARKGYQQDLHSVASVILEDQQEHGIKTAT